MPWVTQCHPHNSPMSRAAVLIITEEEAGLRKGKSSAQGHTRESGRVGSKHGPTPAPISAVTLHQNLGTYRSACCLDQLDTSICLHLPPEKQLGVRVPITSRQASSTEFKGRGWCQIFWLCNLILKVPSGACPNLPGLSGPSPSSADLPDSPKQGPNSMWLLGGGCSLNYHNPPLAFFSSSFCSEQ